MKVSLLAKFNNDNIGITYIGSVFYEAEQQYCPCTQMYVRHQVWTYMHLYTHEDTHPRHTPEYIFTHGVDNNIQVHVNIVINKVQGYKVQSTC